VREATAAVLEPQLKTVIRRFAAAEKRRKQTSG
jgi:hypothetical protein